MKINKSIKLMVCSLAMTIAPMVQAAYVHATGTVTVTGTYLDYGGGDFIFRISNPPAGCIHGYWFSPSQPGFKSAVAYVLKAHANGETVLISADTAQRWPGSTGDYCKVDYVGTPY